MQRQSTRRSFMGMAAGLGALAPAAVFKSAVADEKAGPPARAFGLVADYYPHWATREGALPDAVLSALAVGTVIGVHHETTIDDIERLLSFPEKRFRIAWYAESNLQESEDAAPLGLPLAVRITEAGMRQAWLASRHGADRFADLIELDAARDKADGRLEGVGNQPVDWIADARAVKEGGFRYLAKNLKLGHVHLLRALYGDDFVPRLVFEDVTAGSDEPNRGYRRDARLAVREGEITTLVVHEGAYGEFRATPLAEAQAVVDADFNVPHVEAWWGRGESEAGVVKIKSFGERLAPRVP